MHESDSLNTQIVEIDGPGLEPAPEAPYTPERIAMLRRELEWARDYGTPIDRAHAVNALRRLAEIEAEQNKKNGTEN